MRRRLLVVFALACVGVAVSAAPAVGQERPRDRDRRITVTGDVVVARGDTADGVVISLDGDARIDGVVDHDVIVGRGDVRVNGRVSGDVVVIRGDAVINGHVGGDVVVVSGRAIVHDGASVRGDVTSGKQPRVAHGTVRGKVEKLDLGSIFGGVLIGALVFLWIAVTASMALLGLAFLLIAPRAADAAATAGRRVGPSIGFGLLVGIGGPAVCIGVLASILGIPLGLGLLGALAMLSPLGYVTTALVLGRLLVKRPGTGARIGAFLAGFAILRVLALIPGLGFLVWFLACLYGIGALSSAAWRAGRGEGPTAQPSGGDESAGESEPGPNGGTEPTDSDAATAAADTDTAEGGDRLQWRPPAPAGGNEPTPA